MPTLLRYLVLASTALAREGTVPSLPVVRGIPVQGSDFSRALTEHGHHLTPEGDGYRMIVPLTSGLGCAILLREAAIGWISAAAGYVPEQRLPSGDQAILTLQKLQRWTAAGRFVIDDAGLLRVDVPIPVLDDPVRPVVWTASQCAAMLQTAATHFGLTVSQ